MLGTFLCQTCNAFVFEGTFFPTDDVLKYKCKDDHVSFIEEFKVLF